MTRATMSILALCCLALIASNHRASAGAKGVNDGRLAPCPDRPNCVSSQATDAVHAIAPLRYATGPEIALQRLRQVIESLPRTRIVIATDSYLHAEFTSALLRFVDDVEFQFDAINRLIHVRSASRVGYSDLGVNRRRVEIIRKAFEHQRPAPDTAP